MMAISPLLVLCTSELWSSSSPGVVQIVLRLAHVWTLEGSFLYIGNCGLCRGGVGLEGEVSVVATRMEKERKRQGNQRR